MINNENIWKLAKPSYRKNQATFSLAKNNKVNFLNSKKIKNKNAAVDISQKKMSAAYLTLFLTIFYLPINQCKKLLLTWVFFLLRYHGDQKFQVLKKSVSFFSMFSY